MPPLDRPAEMRPLLKTDRPWSVYALGDLSPRLFPHGRWFAAPVLFTIGCPDDLRPLLDEIAAEARRWRMQLRPAALAAGADAFVCLRGPRHFASILVQSIF